MKLSLAACMLLLGLFGPLSAATVNGLVPPALLSPDQLRQDLRFLQDLVARTHPEIQFSANANELEAAVARVRSQLVRPMTKDQAWLQFSTLNPVFADAHVSVLNSDPHSQTSALHKVGRGLFPFEVSVDTAGRVYVLSELGGAPSPHVAASIEAINGVPILELSRALLDRTNGDTAAFRAVNLSSRWWWFYWKVFGTPETYEIELKLPSGTSVVRVPASLRDPSWLADSEGVDFDRAFRFRHMSDDIAVLTVNTFSWTDKRRFYDFTQRVFTSLRDTRTRTLVIDIRQNGGGDDDMWKDGILRYIATRPYRHGSSFLLRVIEGRQREGQKVGDLVKGQIQSWVQPGQDEGLLFTGKVYVLVGGSTYSSAVLFANVVQDFGFGKLVGAGGYARTRQSGGIQLYTLPNSQLQIVVPRFVLDRPSGAREPAFVSPDVPFADNPFDREQVLISLRAWLKSDKARE